MNDIRLLGRVFVTGRIRLLSGLHIGAGPAGAGIGAGGSDTPVVRQPVGEDPYIPGSSLKGRLRFLLDWAFERVGKGAAREDLDPADPVLRIFGAPTGDGVWSGGPTRLIVRDATLDPAWRARAFARGWPLTEEKGEIAIDRIAGKAHDRSAPRHTERVSAGAQFDAEFVFRVYDTGDGGARDAQCLNWLLAGLSLLEQDALGGSGSRGYGRIRFEDLVFRDLGGTAVPLGDSFRVARFDRAEAPTIVTLGGA
jgi:CRISPR-associated protein Csm3